MEVVLKSIQQYPMLMDCLFTVNVTEVIEVLIVNLKQIYVAISPVKTKAFVRRLTWLQNVYV